MQRPQSWIFRRTASFSVLLSVCALLLAAAGCRSVATEEEEPGETTQEHVGFWTGSELENELGGSDPIEGFNRSMFLLTDLGINFVADPLGRIYATIFPRPFIEHLNNVCINLEYPARLVSCLLRMEWDGAGDETVRFLANTTLGIAGIFDVAEYWWQIPTTKSDFGQTFAAWGIGPGCTLVLPFSRQINVRDNVGLIFDVAFDLKTYIPYAGSATALNRLVLAHREYTRWLKGSADPYKGFREMSLLGRELELRMWFYRYVKMTQRAALLAAQQSTEASAPKAPSLAKATAGATAKVMTKPAHLRGQWIDLQKYLGQDPVSDSLRVTRLRVTDDDDYWFMRLSLFNRDFTNNCTKIKISLDPELDDLECGFWKAPAPEDGQAPRRERLCILLPGIGGNYFDNTPVALAQLMHNHGLAVVTLNSIFTWQYTVSRPQLRLPGYMPDDVDTLRYTIVMLLEKLREKELIDDPEIILAGYSFGGMHTLAIADVENQRGNPLNISRFVAINPPVDLRRAMNVADRLQEISSKWTAQETITALVNLAGGMLLQEQNPNAATTITQVDRDHAKFAAALSFRMAMRPLLMMRHKLKPIPGIKTRWSWFRRNKLYCELDRINFMMYSLLIVAEHPGATLDELLGRCSLRALASTLKNDSRIRVLHNYNDFLLSDEDREFLDSTLEDRMIWFPEGGHLGNLYMQRVQNTIALASIFKREPKRKQLK